MCGETYSFQCGSNYQSAWGSYSSKGCGTSAAQQACYNEVQYYQCQSSGSYTHCGSSGSGTVTPVSVVTAALQDATTLGAGVQGAVGCTVDANGQPVAPSLSTLPTGDNTDGLVLTLTGVSNSVNVLGSGIGDQINLDTGSGNTLVVGDGAGDQINVTTGGDSNILMVGNGDGDSVFLNVGSNNEIFAGNGAGDTLFISQGDNNALIAGDGAGDTLMVGTGNNNDLYVGNGNGDLVFVGSGDNNCLTVGDGVGDSLAVGTGDSNALTAGIGVGDVLEVDTGDNNLLIAGNGAQDVLTIGTGDHNTLLVGLGAGDELLVSAGNYNLLEAYTSNGAGDILSVGTGDYNVLIGGTGAGDIISLGTGDHNVLAVDAGTGDLIEIGSGNYNTILDGNGANDIMLVGGNWDGTSGSIGAGINAGNDIVIGNGDGDQAWGSLGDGNAYLTGAGNDLVHTGGGADFVYVDNHTEQSAAAMKDPFHLTTQDTEAQNLFADGGNDTFILQGTQQGCMQSCSTVSFNHCGSDVTVANAINWQSDLRQVDGDAPGLGTTVMTGGGGVEKYWFSDLWGNAVITDFNSAHGDRIMIGGAYDGQLQNLGSVNFQYIHSAYDTANSGNVDLLITFGNSASNISQSITLVDYKPQDTGNLFNNVTYTNPAQAEAALSHIFDFSQADNQAVTNEVASLAAQHLILH